MRTKCRSRRRGIGVNRESFRPGNLLPKRLATGDLLTNRKICEKVRLIRGREVSQTLLNKANESGCEPRSALASIKDSEFDFSEVRQFVFGRNGCQTVG